MRWVLLIVLACAVAHADDKPWQKDVPADKQREALAIYQKANTFFERAEYKEAYAEYQKALALWDHPAIRYNAAVCLINMDRPVEAYDNLMSALRFGEAPLSPELYKQGLTYKKLLENQTAVLEIQSDDAGAQISLDNRQLFVAPGSQTRRLTTGDHMVVAEKKGYETKTQPITLKAGDKRTLVLKLQPLAAGRRLERRWAKWKPWAVVVGGLVVGSAGLPFWFDARSKFATVREAINQSCAPLGCDDRMDLESRAAVLGRSDDLALESPAKTEAAISYSAFAIGGAAVAVGVTLALLNQPRLGAPVVTPTVGPDHVGAVVSASW